jgi:hypothetical protein
MDYRRPIDAEAILDNQLELVLRISKNLIIRKLYILIILYFTL